MEAPRPPHLGVTPPIDSAPPGEHEVASSEALVHTLRSLGVYESEEGRQVRQRVLDDLRRITAKWCEGEWAAARARGGSSSAGGPPDGAALAPAEDDALGDAAMEDDAGSGASCRSSAASEAPRCELRTFGSVRLDVHTPDADIDVVLVAPRHCTRHAFFESLVALLEGDPSIGTGGVMAVRDAYTPVIKLRVGGTDVDLLFAPLAVERLPESLDVMDDGVLDGLDEAAIRSLNGARVAEMLLTLVPDPAVFRVALRAVKRWARCKGLYSNVLGLLGGVNCAILVAFVCQRYPNAAPSTIVGRFFRIFDSWDWPNPVLINEPTVPNGGGANGGDKGGADGAAAPPNVVNVARYAAWNPRLNPRDRAHLAPIVTPAHPTMNSSYNVGAPQLRAIQDELKRGVEATRRIDRLAEKWDAAASPTGDRGADLRDAWRKLFGPSDFFTLHRHYVQVDVSADDDAGLRKWNAWCESRLRNLVVALDTPGYVRARPHATHVERECDALDDATGEPTGAKRKTRSFFVALSFETHVQHIDLTPCVREFSSRVNAWEHRSPDMDLELRHTPRDALPREALDGHYDDDDDDDDDEHGDDDNNGDANGLAVADALRNGDLGADETDGLYLHEEERGDDDAANKPPPPAQPRPDDEGSLSPKKPRAASADMVDVDDDAGPAPPLDEDTGPPQPPPPLSWAAVAKRSAEPKPKRMCPS